jgi:hypothetical protein
MPIAELEELVDQVIAIRAERVAPHLTTAIRPPEHQLPTQLQVSRFRFIIRESNGGMNTFPGVKITYESQD